MRDSFVTEADIAEIARLGFDTVRVPINHALLEDDDRPFVIKMDGLERLDRLVDWCEAHGVRAVLDLHAAPGGQSPWFMADPDDVDLWHSQVDRDRTVALWNTIATRYRDRPGVAGYDILNEPSPPDGKALFDLDRRIADGIRDVDPDHLVLLEGPSGASDFTPFTAPVTWNEAYSFHEYTFLGDNRASDLAKYHALSVARGIPLWAGEFGLTDAPSTASTVAMFDAPKNGVSGSAFWTWKQVKTGDDGLVDITAPLPHWKKVVDWMSAGWVPRPSSDDVEQGLREFLAAIPLAKCTENPAMIRALGGKP